MHFSHVLQLGLDRHSQCLCMETLDLSSDEIYPPLLKQASSTVENASGTRSFPKRFTRREAVL